MPKFHFFINKMIGSYVRNLLNLKYLQKLYQNEKTMYRPPIVMKIEGQSPFYECLRVPKFHILLINSLEVTLKFC